MNLLFGKSGSQLRAGGRYRSRGPVDDPVRVRIAAITARGYVTEGTRQTAAIIRFGCEEHWEPDDEEQQ